MAIHVVHCKLYRKAEYIGRPGPLGNPYHVSRDGSRERVIELYKYWLVTKLSDRDWDVCQEMDRLYKIAASRDLYLGCWCAPEPCHGDIIKEILEARKKLD